MEAGKKRLAGDTARAANTDEVKELRREAKDLKEVVAEQTLELRLLKKSMYDGGGDHEGGIPRLRNWKSSGWSKTAICLRVRHWPSWAFRARRSIAGTIGICSAGKPDCRINLPSQSTSGTVCQRK